MKIGDYVTHKLTGGRMKITKISDHVVTVEDIDGPERWSMRWQRYEKPVYIIAVKNLELIPDPSQLNLQL